MSCEGVENNLGDLVWLAVKSALHAQFAHDDTCPWCLVLKTNLATKDRQESRTLANAREFAHLPPLDQEGNEVFPFTCKLCNVEFESRETWEKEDMSGEKLAKMFTAVHRGHVWRRASLSCEPRQLIMCLLHMRLSFCASLWKWLIKPSAQAKRQEVANQVLRMLQKDGLNIWRLKKITATTEEAIKEPGFSGGAAEKVMGHFSDYMDVLECKEKDKG